MSRHVRTPLQGWVSIDRFVDDLTRGRKQSRPARKGGAKATRKRTAKVSEDDIVAYAHAHPTMSLPELIGSLFKEGITQREVNAASRAVMRIAAGQ